MTGEHTEESAAVRRVMNAWNLAGPAPHIHEREKRRLLTNWPTLHAALTALGQLDPHYNPGDPT